MSLDSVQPFAIPSPLPRKRARDAIMLASEEVSSKCAEIFVTNNADKWTFFCSYCQKATSDIGVFICHIKLEHLNDVGEQASKRKNNLFTPTINSTQPDATNVQLPMTTIHTAVAGQESLSDDQLQFLQCNKVKEEVTDDVASKEQEYSQTICSKVAQIAEITTLNQAERNEIGEHTADKESFAAKNYLTTTELTYVIKEEDSISCHSLSDEEATCAESQDNHKASGSSKVTKKRKISPTAEDDADLLHHKCPSCDLGFKTKQGAIQHILHCHDGNYHKKLPIKCHHCLRGFHTKSGLKAHLTCHDKTNQLQCSVCGSRHKKTYFITHVMSHESGTCYPCQVCGQIYDSQDERWQHWQSHAKEKPYDCKICYRRYRKPQYLKRHVKVHNQYQCDFCPVEFTSLLAQRAPYVCIACEKLPDIKQKAQHLRTLAYKNHVFESDEETEANPFNLDEIDDELCPDEGSDLEFIAGDIDANTDELSNVSAAKEVKCPYCDNVFKSRQALAPHLKCHINNEHNSFAHKCSLCNRGFQTKSGLSFHHKTHNKTKYQFKCPLCSFTGYREGDFINHVLQHENETCFPCQVCAKVFASNAERLTHWATHVNDKPHGCSYCYRRFSLKHILHRHMKTHKEYTA